jgi:hypothetical protein
MCEIWFSLLETNANEFEIVVWYPENPVNGSILVVVDVLDSRIEIPCVHGIPGLAEKQLLPIMVLMNTEVHRHHHDSSVTVRANQKPIYQEIVQFLQQYQNLLCTAVDKPLSQCFERLLSRL